MNHSIMLRQYLNVNPTLKNTYVPLKFITKRHTWRYACVKGKCVEHVDLLYSGEANVWGLLYPAIVNAGEPPLR